jgi:hypothetical protein
MNRSFYYQIQSKRANNTINPPASKKAIIVLRFNFNIFILDNNIGVNISAAPT